MPWPSWARDGATLRFGVIADVHKDIMHDADVRLKTFVDHMKAKGVDFVVQLGDFCVPKPANKGFLKIWDHFPDRAITSSATTTPTADSNVSRPSSGGA